jgi:plasmid stabilization system protein ParE
VPRVFFTAAARADLAHALAWYEEREPVIVPQFLEALRTVVARIANNPRQFPHAPNQTRRAMLRRFPYLLIFREAGGAAYVVAIFHMSRDPLTWQRRP